LYRISGEFDFGPFTSKCPRQLSLALLVGADLTIQRLRLTKPGILGREIVHELGKDPSKWQTVHAISRSQKEDYPNNVKHDTIDLTGNAQEMASQLKDVEGEYIFFAAYLQGSSEQENWALNGAMLKNFLSALQMAGALTKVKRVVLVTGAKQYGLHLGRPKNPMIESDPRIEGKDRATQLLLYPARHTSRILPNRRMGLGRNISQRCNWSRHQQFHEPIHSAGPVRARL
jgi:hypothetical protein